MVEHAGHLSSLAALGKILQRLADLLETKWAKNVGNLMQNERERRSGDLALLTVTMAGIPWSYF